MFRFPFVVCMRCTGSFCLAIIKGSPNDIYCIIEEPFIGLLQKKFHTVLMSEMEQARIKSTNLDYLNKLTKLDLLVIDDFGLMDLDLDKCRDLFEVLDTRDGRKSTVVISQFPVSTWFDMFADNTYADACLTRITDKHHTYRLEMNGINMRETE